MSFAATAPTQMGLPLQAISLFGDVPRFRRIGSHMVRMSERIPLFTLSRTTTVDDKPSATFFDAFSSPTHADHQSDERMFVKISSIVGNLEVEDIRRDAGVLRMLCHPHIINVSHMWVEGGFFGIATPRLTCDLVKYTERRMERGFRGMKRSQLRTSMIQIISAIQHMHNGVVDESGVIRYLAHGDLSAENVMMARTRGDIDSLVTRMGTRFGDANGNIVYPGGCVRLPQSAFAAENRDHVPHIAIIDCGGAFSLAQRDALCSPFIPSSSSSSSVARLLARGKRSYTAPEMPDQGMHMSAPLSPFKLDTWAIGAILLTCLTSTFFRHGNNVDTMPVTLNDGRQSSLFRECQRAGAMGDVNQFRSALVAFELEYRRTKIRRMIDTEDRYAHLRDSSDADIARMADTFDDDGHAMTLPMIDFLVHTLDWDPSTRYGINQLAAHPFLREIEGEAVNGGGVCMLEEALPFVLKCHSIHSMTSSSSSSSGAAVGAEEEQAAGAGSSSSTSSTAMTDDDHDDSMSGAAAGETGGSGGAGASGEATEEE